MSKPKIENIKSLRISDNVRSKLSLYNYTIQTGYNNVLKAPLGKTMADELLKSVDSMISRSKVISKPLLDLETLNRSKFGPRSIAKPWSERRATVYDYFGFGNRFTLDSSVSARANLRPVSFSKALSNLKNDTNSGLPYLTRKSEVKRDYSLDKLKLELGMKYPAVLFTRTQEGGKTRNVWGYPFSDTLNEMRFYLPLLEFQKQTNYRQALLGPSSVNLAISSMMNRLCGDETLISMDFSTYDACVKKWLQKPSFEYISNLYQSSYKSDIMEIFERFNTIGLTTPDGVLYGSHGVPSGSTFTNEVDSIAQYLVARDSKYLLNDSYQIQGDDGVYTIKDSQVSNFVSHFRKYGLLVNEDKSYKSKTYCVYLQNLYDLEYRVNGFIGGIYPLYRALNRICFQERWTDFEAYGLEGKDYYSLRTISILENCKYHPLFEDFVKLIASKDKYYLAYSENAVAKYMQFYTSTEGLSDLIINQFGDNIRGLASFETIKLINKMR